jgi:hypothetical protein
LRRAMTVLVACGVCVAAGAAPALAWGPAAHRVVVAEAVGTLPKAMGSFYKDHRLEMPSLALDAPEATEEGADRRFEADRLQPFPFATLPHVESGVTVPAGAKPLGRLPWLIQESYGRLVEAFRSGDKVRILAESDVIAGLVADLHNPLALTDNADGQKTGQHGLWVRVSVKLPEAMQKRLKLNPEAARYLDDPKGYVFTSLGGTYVWLDNLLYLEDLAHRSAGGYGDIYFDTLEQRVGGLVRDRLSEAAADAGSYWYTAWTVAGRPALK